MRGAEEGERSAWLQIIPVRFDFQGNLLEKMGISRKDGMIVGIRENMTIKERSWGIFAYKNVSILQS